MRHLRLTRAAAATLGLLGFVGFAATGLATEIATLDVIQPSPEHPRHDHQLIFPLQDGRLLLVWSEYYRKSAPQAAGVQRDDMPCRISAMISADRGRSWGDPFVLQENTGKLNVKHPNLLRLPSGEILFFFTQCRFRSN